VNQVNLVGRVARTPELRKAGTGKSYMFLVIAVGYWDRRSQAEKADFISVTLWGKDAERCKSLMKGSLVRITGRISSGSFKKDGKTEYRTEVVAEEIDFLAKPKSVVEGTA
jgi:single-strand DNA-binding protein